MVELYRRIWIVTGRQQIILIVLSLLVAALAAAPLQFQKDIINGLSESMQMQQLVLLCAGYMAVLALSSSLKFAMNYRSAILSEWVIKRIRNFIYEDNLGPESETDKARGTIVTMIAAEAEEVGNFAGEALATPLLQLGILVSVTLFVAVSQPYLGLFVVGVIVPQAVLVLTLQKFINRRVAQRVKVLRHSTGTISAQKVKEVQQAVIDDFNEIFETRRHIFKLKFSMKFAINLLQGAGIVGILLIGGIMFLDGKTDIGTVVASLTALAKVNDPWRALIAFYRNLSTVRVKFDLLVGS
ncbi:MAG: ABC transporter transmembrane domain-containing protein [Pseudomonadota bacterium]